MPSQWWFGEDDDKVVLIVNGTVARSKSSGRLLGNVVELSPAGVNGKITVAFDNKKSVNMGLHEFSFTDGPFSLTHGLNKDMRPEEFAMTAVESIPITRESNSSTNSIPTPRAASTPNSTVNKKRRSSQKTDVIDLTPAKRQAVEIESKVDIAIHDKCLGEYDVPLDSLEAPPQRLLIREISTQHKDKIKEGLKETAACSTLLPVLLIGQEFNRVAPESSRYYTLGGNHLTKAMKELNGDPAYKCLNSIRVRVYSNLDRMQSLRVASLHNLGTHLVQDGNLKDTVELCRSHLYAMHSLDPCLSEPPPSNKVWRVECSIILGRKTPPAEKELKALEPIFQMAQYSRQCYEKLKKVFSIQEEKTGRCPKQTVFMKLQGLPETVKLRMLSEVVSERLSLGDMAKECAIEKKLLTVQKELVAQLPVKTWKEAEEQFPQHTTETALQPFTGCNFKQGIPRPFLAFVRDAVKWREQEATATELPPDTLTSGKCKIAFVHDSIPSLAGYPRATLIVADMERNEDLDTIKRVVETAGKLHCTVGIKVSMTTISIVRKGLQDRQYQGLKNVFRFTPGKKDKQHGSLKALLTATYRQDLAKTHRDVSDVFLDKMSLMEHLVCTESEEGDWLIDMTDKADVAVAAVVHSRNCLVWSLNVSALNDAKTRIARTIQRELDSSESEDSDYDVSTPDDMTSLDEASMD